MSNLTKSAFELSKLLKSGQLKSENLIKETFEYIEKSDPVIKSFISLDKENALEKARHIDKKRSEGKTLSDLAGIPISIKDNICVKGGRTTCSSKMLKNFISPYDATVMEKLDEHGLISVGKVNLDEFAMGSSTENSAFFRTNNPWDLSRVPGGSSGGSAASVASFQVPFSLGSDTGGSIRQPAAFCGISGLKPTYGRVSRYGLIAFASSLDQIGPFARSVEDIALLMNAICGFDPKDSTSSDKDAPDFTQGLNKEIKDLKIAVPKSMLGDKIAPDIKEVTLSALNKLKDLGATWEEIDFDVFEYAVSTYYIIAPAEASANLARFDGVRYTHRAQNTENLKEMFIKTRGEGFGPEVQRRIILGTYVLSSGYYDAYYLKAQKVRTVITRELNKVFEKFDVIATPTSPTAPFKEGEHAKDPLAMYLADIATIPANMAGIPGLSIPAGFTVDGLPVGLQLMSKSYDEATLLNVGHQFQQITNFHKQKPSALSQDWGL